MFIIKYFNNDTFYINITQDILYKNFIMFIIKYFNNLCDRTECENKMFICHKLLLNFSHCSVM